MTGCLCRCHGKMAGVMANVMSKTFRNYSMQKGETIMNVFDRKAKRLHKDRTTMMDDYKVYEYIKEEVKSMSLILIANR